MLLNTVILFMTILPLIYIFNTDYVIEHRLRLVISSTLMAVFTVVLIAVLFNLVVDMFIMTLLAIFTLFPMLYAFNLDHLIDKRLRVIISLIVVLAFSGVTVSHIFLLVK